MFLRTSRVATIKSSRSRPGTTFRLILRIRHALYRWNNPQIFFVLSLDFALRADGELDWRVPGGFHQVLSTRDCKLDRRFQLVDVAYLVVFPRGHLAAQDY